VEHLLFDVAGWLVAARTGEPVRDEELAQMEAQWALTLPNSFLATERNWHMVGDALNPEQASRGRAVAPLAELVLGIVADAAWGGVTAALEELKGAGLAARVAERGAELVDVERVVEAERAGAGELDAAVIQAVRQGNCFVAGTAFRTPEGAKAVECFRPGDVLLSRAEHDPEGRLQVVAVQEVFVRVAPVLEVVVKGRVIGATAEHPFYVRGAGWRCAGELRPGDEFSSHDGAWVEVETVRATGKVATV
jgi:hypothetical protein